MKLRQLHPEAINAYALLPPHLLTRYNEWLTSISFLHTQEQIAELRVFIREEVVEHTKWKSPKEREVLDKRGDLVLQLFFEHLCETVEKLDISFLNCVYSSTINQFVDMIHKMIVTRDAADIWHQLRKYYAEYQWRVNGKKTYAVSNGLAKAFTNTKLGNYACTDLRLPNKSIYLEFEEKSVHLPDPKFKDDSEYLRGVYVEEANLFDAIGVPGVRVWRISPVFDDKNLARAPHSMYFILLKDNEGTKDAIRDFKSGTLYYEHPSQGRIEITQGSGTNNPSVSGILMDVFRLVINIVIYITRSDADIVLMPISPEYVALRERMLAAAGSKREKLKKELKKYSGERRPVLAPTYTIKRWGDKERNAHSAGGRKVRVRHLVSGHWRNQVCGVGRLEHHVVWIEPYWKGPEEAPLTARVARVK